MFLRKILMNFKKNILVFLLVTHSIFSLHDKTSTLLMHGIGACFIGNYFYKSLPDFFKNDEHKKPTRKSIFMVGKTVATLWYIHKMINYSKLYWDTNYVMGSLKNDEFQTTVTNLLKSFNWTCQKNLKS